jgi:hypothetical protein
MSQCWSAWPIVLQILRYVGPATLFGYISIAGITIEAYLGVPLLFERPAAGLALQMVLLPPYCLLLASCYFASTLKPIDPSVIVRARTPYRVLNYSL